MLGLGIKPEVEVFDVAMLYNAAELVKAGLLRAPAARAVRDGSQERAPRAARATRVPGARARALLPGATWTAAGIGRQQLTVNHWALELGGHARTGLEDNVRFDEQRLATSNAELVARVAALTAEYGRTVASPGESRVLLGLEVV